MTKLRHIIISDIHGTLEELNELIEKIKYNPITDRLIVGGDLLHRGDDSVGVVRRLRELNIECVMGNHENRFLKWYKSQNTKLNNIYDSKDFYHKFTNEDIQYIANMPYYIKIPEYNLIIVHAGIKPNIPIEKQSKNDLMYLRFTDSDRNFISIKKVLKYGVESCNAKFWTEFGPFGVNVVYGHQVWDEPRIDTFDDGTKCVGIDTGCVFGNKLTALIWETFEFVEVKAKKVYYQSNLDGD